MISIVMVETGRISTIETCDQNGNSAMIAVNLSSTRLRFTGMTAICKQISLGYRPKNGFVRKFLKKRRKANPSPLKDW